MTTPGTHPADVVLGVDVGTTSTKAVAFSADARTWSEAEEGYPLHEPAPGRAEQDAEQVVTAALAAIRRAAAGAVQSGARVRALAFSAGMHSLVGLDGGGRPLTPVLTWGDTRATAQADRLREHHADLYRRTGTPHHPMSPLAKLMWLREEQPELFARVDRWVQAKDLVLLRLCGELVIDHSCASGTGLLGLRRLEWDPEALSLAGVGPERLPALVPAEHRLDLRADVGLPPGTPVVAGAGDGPLANLGVGAVHPGVAACSIGTSGALRVMVEEPAVDDRGRVFCYGLTPGRWVVGGAINNGGAVLRWATRALGPGDGADGELDRDAARSLLDMAAQVPAGSDGLIMLPYLLSERAPHWNALPRGAYVGLTYAHTRGHLVRAALEGVCQQLALVLGSMRAAGNEVREIRATGGFARSPLWRQMLADALGMPIAFPAGHQGSAFGAALLGMEALGMIDSLDVAAERVPIESTVEPDPGAAAVYAATLPIFDDLYDELAPAFRALHDLGESDEAGLPD